MAKGFKVIPKETEPKEEWDYDAIKERCKGKTIVFCLPGRGCSYIFLKKFLPHENSGQDRIRTLSNQLCFCVFPTENF